MPSDLPAFLKALHKELQSFMSRQDRNMEGTQKISIRWLAQNGESEEWAIDLEDEY